jgi:hypothetical protein
MEEDLGKDEIVLKQKKPRSEAQVKAFEKAREIRLENSKIKKEKIAEVKEQVKNRNKTTLEKVEQTPVEKPVEKKEKKIIKDESDSEPDIVVVKKKKKPKVIYMEESDDEPEPQVIKKKKDPVIEEKEPLKPVLAKPPQTIRFF